MSARRRGFRLRIPLALASLRPCLLLALAAAPVERLEAQARVVRTFASEAGLAAPPVWALAQDDRGFLWIGAEGGLFRFDGREIRRWAPEEVRGSVVHLARDREGGVVVLEASGHAWLVEPEGVAAVPLPGCDDETNAAPPPSGSSQLAIDGAGGWWFVREGRVWMRGAEEGATWSRLSLSGLDEEGPDLVFPHPTTGGALVSTAEGLWRVDETGDGERILSGARVRGATFRSQNRVAALVNVPTTGGIRVVEWSPQGLREIASEHLLPRGRPIDLVERRGMLWASLDRYLVGIADEGPGAGRPDVLDGSHGIESGGPLLVDSEGSLWLGSFAGLHQLPEPETRIWREPEGLASRHARFVARTGSRLWVSTWSGGTSFVPGVGAGEAAWLREDPGWSGGVVLCGTATRGYWSHVGGALARLSEQGAVRELSLDEGDFSGCTPALDGGVWVATPGTLRRVRNGVVLFEGPALAGLLPYLHDAEDRLWLAGPGRICVANAAGSRGVHEAELACSAVPGLAVVTSMASADGITLAGSSSLGLLARRDGRWTEVEVPGLPTRSVFGLEPSPRGGTWVVANGLLARIELDPEGAVRVVERLSRGQGIPAPSAGGLVEEADGTVWLATSRGVIELPPSARFFEPGPPGVELVDARVDGTGVRLVGGMLELPRGRNRLALRFAALSFRDPGELRHEVRIAPDTTWLATVGEPVFQWTDLRPGTHHVEYRASVDGVRWSATPLALNVKVLPPWYASVPFRILVACLLFLAGWAAYRGRVSRLVELERQRTRIATDLHDQVGSGLASVGILSSLLANGHMAESDRRGVALQVAGVAEELGVALSDIVWTLDPRIGGLADLAGRLAEHGERLFGEGSVRFTTRFPTRWPRAETEVSVRRSVLLVGLEALHNAARHANPGSVELSLLPGPGTRWTLRVEDDGTGVAAQGEGAVAGRGVASMRARAREIGASFELGSNAGGGTRVEFVFPLAAPRRTPFSRLFRRQDPTSPGGAGA